MKPIWICPLAFVLAIALNGCSTSVPPRYHGLTGAAPSQPSGSARLLVEILPVAVPERLNREEMVLTGVAGQLDVRDTDHWAAPLSDEIRQVLTDSLWGYLRASDVYLSPVAPGVGGLAQYRLALRVERFEAVPGQRAAVEGSWTVRLLPQGYPTTCRANITVPLPALTPDAAAAALSTATGQLARQVADSIGRMDQGLASVCPSEGS
ncbi:MAG TPA: PqiC family protein [Telmatospirillum sp.]|nr:PqiC family protein [Telmatospirillum sp.]